MADTLNSWKQFHQAKQGFEQLNEVIVGPQGGVPLSLERAVKVVGCAVTAKDSDKVVINAEVCCPPIEFTNVMGEQDINRPGETPREDFGRVIWNTNSPTSSRLTWGATGSPTSFLVEGTEVEAKQHELFFSPLVVGSAYEFIVGGCRNFCGDCASSQVYSFRVGVLTEVAILASIDISVLTDLLTCVSTTLPLSEWGAAPSSGGVGGVTTPVTVAIETALCNYTPSIVSLTSTNMFITTAVTTVP